MNVPPVNNSLKLIITTTSQVHTHPQEHLTTYIDGDNLFGPNTYFNEADEE